MTQDRRAYLREYQRARRAADPEKARADGRAAYEARKAKEAEYPELRKRREFLGRQWRKANAERLRENMKRWKALVMASPEKAEELRRKQREVMARYRLDVRNKAKISARGKAAHAFWSWGSWPGSRVARAEPRRPRCTMTTTRSRWWCAGCASCITRKPTGTGGGSGRSLLLRHDPDGAVEVGFDVFVEFL